MNNDLSVTAIASFIVIVAALVGGYVSIKTTIAKTSREIQEHVMNALSTENELLRNRLTRVETDYKHLSEMMKLVTAIFEKRGILIEIDGDQVQVRDVGTGTVTVRKRPSSPLDQHSI